MSQIQAFVNGEFIPYEQATIPVSDLGLQRGYGVFDFFRTVHGKPLFLDQHLDRLCHSLAIMHLHLPMDRTELKQIITDLINHNNLPHTGIRVTITGGASEDGYSIANPHVMIVERPIAPPPATMQTSPYRLITHNYQRQLPTVKTTDYLQAIWLQPKIREAGAQDVLYCYKGMALECPRSNFFIVNAAQQLITPANGVLKGITRANILQLAAKEMEVIEGPVHLEDIRTAKEVFISSSTKRIIPVTAVNDWSYQSYGEQSVASRLFRLLHKLEQ
jgi:D-alanine transaminase/branched-chain amino acid aminotransferase